MKKRKTKKSLQSRYDQTPAAKMFPGRARLEKKGIKQVTPKSTIEPPVSYTAKNKRLDQRRKAAYKATPAKFKAALRRFGMGKADAVIRKRGTYYTAAGVYQAQRHNLKVVKEYETKRRKDGTISVKKIEVQNTYDFRSSASRGWYVEIKNGILQNKLIRFKTAHTRQRAARRQERIRIVAAKTGQSQKEVKKILAGIRAQELRKLKNFRKTKKYKNLTRDQKLRHNINNRMAAIFGALCDILGIQGGS
jgi:hypothetical protein